MQKKVDVIIIGAGTAGLSAAKTLGGYGKSFLLIDQGPVGSTCARVGCMPSKALIEYAHDIHRVRKLQTSAVVSGELRIHQELVLQKVRDCRDHFVQHVRQEMEQLEPHFICGRARFKGPRHITIDDKHHLEAKSIIIATGSRPVVPDQWPKGCPTIVTTDNFFELTALPRRWAVVGLGPIGLELGQALAFLGAEVHGYNLTTELGGLKNSALNAKAREIFSKDMTLDLGHAIEVEETLGKLSIQHGNRSQPVDAVLAAMGRQPNLDDLDLEQTGCLFDRKGFPVLDQERMAIKGLPIYLAGDVDQQKTVLHEASDDGRIAAYHASHDQIWSGERRTPLSIVFTHPGIATVGSSTSDDEAVITGRVSFEKQGRAQIMRANQGALHLHVGRESGRLLGADILAPEAEHLAHQLAWAIQQKQDIHQFLRLPFYHPTVEEGLRTAAQDAAKQLKSFQT